MKSRAQEKLEWSVRALSQSAYIQLELFPDFVEVADELALGFEEAYRECRDSPEGRELVPDQKARIEALDQQLGRMSEDSNDYWTNASLKESLDWSRLRSLAREVLLSLKWSTERPPKSNEIYVNNSPQ